MESDEDYDYGDEDYDYDDRISFCRTSLVYHFNKYVTTTTEGIETNIFRKTRDSFLSVVECIKYGNKYHDSLQFALVLDRSIVEHRDPLGETLLMNAMKMGTEASIDLLLKYGSDIEARDNRGFTPLCFAIKAKKVENIKYAHMRGADVNVSTETRSALPLTLALNTGTFSERQKMLDELREGKIRLVLPIEERFTLFKHSIDHCDPKLLADMLTLKEYKKYINIKDRFGRTPLIYALQLYRPKEMTKNNKLVSLLLKNNASIELRDNLGRDAFFVAAQFERVQFVDQFIKMGYKLDSTNHIDEYNSDHPNVIFATVKYSEGSSESCYLISKLIDLASEEVLNHIDREGNTLLHLLAERKFVKVYEKLLDRNVPKQSCIIRESILATSTVRYYVPGYMYLQSLIRLGKCTHIEQAFRSGALYHRDYSVSAIKFFDSNEPDLCGIPFFDDKACRILNILMRQKFEQTYPVESVEVDLISAICLERYKAVYFLAKYYFNVKYQGFKLTKLFELASINMARFLKWTLNLPYQTARYKVSDLKKFFMFRFNKAHFYGFSASIEFLYEYLSWKANHYNGNISKYNNALSLAIYYGRTDIVTILIQQGPKVILNKKFEQSIEMYFPHDLKKLYKEIKGVGLLTLEQMARIAVRSDLRSFHEAWSCNILRPILQFESKMYKFDLNDRHLLDVLYRAATWKEYTSLNYFLDEIDMDVSTFINHFIAHDTIILRDILNNISLIYENFQFKNPLFAAIENDDCDELKHLIEVEKVDVNDFYGEIFNALHYATILNKGEIVELLKGYGSEELPTKSSPQLSYQFLRRKHSTMLVPKNDLDLSAGFNRLNVH